MINPVLKSSMREMLHNPYENMKYPSPLYITKKDYLQPSINYEMLPYRAAKMGEKLYEGAGLIGNRKIIDL